MKRIYILWALPRSGSTPVAKVIGHYLSQAHGYISLGEYFNLYFTGISEKGGRLMADERRWGTLGMYGGNQNRIVWEKDWRLRNLQKSDGRYFLKTSPRHLIGSFRTRLL